jgi:hypothetical protein
MDSKEIQGLMEAYQQIYAPQKEVQEAVKGADPEMRKAAADERKVGDKPLPAKEGEKFAKFKASQISYIDKKTKGKYLHGMTREEMEKIDIFDTVLEFLQTEGIAETVEEAQKIMVNNLDAEDIEQIIEASYSAKAARAGKDIGQPGKMFSKIAKEAGKRYGSEERGKKVAGAVLAKLRAKGG